MLAFKGKTLHKYQVAFLTVFMYTGNFGYSLKIEATMLSAKPDSTTVLMN